MFFSHETYIRNNKMCYIYLKHGKQHECIHYFVVSSKQLKMILSRNRFLIFSLRMNSNFEVKDIAKNRGQQTWHPVEASWVFTYWSQITHNSKQVDQLTKTHKTSPPSLGTQRFLFYARHDGGMFHNTHFRSVLQTAIKLSVLVSGKIKSSTSCSPSSYNQTLMWCFISCDHSVTTHSKNNEF